VVGLEEDLLPCAGIQGQAADLDEERRLAYVGITRARELLYLTRATQRVKRGKVLPRTPSRFLEDLPGEAHEVVDPAGPASPPEVLQQAADDVLAGLRARLAGQRTGGAQKSPPGQGHAPASPPPVARQSPAPPPLAPTQPHPAAPALADEPDRG